MPHWQWQETLRLHKVGFHWERAPRSNQITPETQSELNCGDAQHAFVSRNQRASLPVFLSSLHTTQQEQTPQTRKEPKKKGKLPDDLWPGAQRELPCMHTEEVQTEFMTALSLLFLITSLYTHQWTLEATMAEQTHQASLTHLPPRCLCQVIAGGKRKTDQYISHGPDR